MFFGKNSLVTYVVHAFVIFGVFSIFASINPRTSIATNTVIGIAAVLTTYYITKVYLYIKRKVSAYTQKPSLD